MNVTYAIHIHTIQYACYICYSLVYIHIHVDDGPLNYIIRSEPVAFLLLFFFKCRWVLIKDQVFIQYKSCVITLKSYWLLL